MQKSHLAHKNQPSSLLNTSKLRSNPANTQNPHNSRDQLFNFRNSDSSPSPDSHNRHAASLPSPQHSVNSDTISEVLSRSFKDGSKMTPGKEILPPSIQRYLSGGNQISMREAVSGLQIPCNTAHDQDLETMKLITMAQQQEIHNHLASRKPGCNSLASLSPTYAGSPLGSPVMYHSQKATMTSNFPEESIIMTYEDEDAIINFSQNLNPETPFDHISKGNQQMNAWNTNPASQSLAQSNNGISPFAFNHHQHQQPFMNNQPQHGIEQCGQPAQQAAFNPFAQISQEAQFKSCQQVNQLNHDPFHQSNNSNLETQADSEAMPIEEETRGRSNSYLRKLSLPQNRPNISLLQMPGNNSPTDCKSLVSDQISVIQALMESKRSISPTDTNRGLMQYFQKRNSNPENLVASPMLMFQQQEQQQQQAPFQLQPQQVARSQHNATSNLFSNFNGQSQMGFYNQQQQHHQAHFMFSNQHQNFPSQGNSNHFNGMNQHAQFNSYEPEQIQGISSTNTSEQTNMDGYGLSYNSEMNQEWSLPNRCSNINHGKGHEDDAGYLAPEAFLKNDEEDFDMNIIQSEVNFMPQRFNQELLEDSMGDQFFMPESGDIDGFFEQSKGRYGFDI